MKNIKNITFLAILSISFIEKSFCMEGTIMDKRIADLELELPNGQQLKEPSMKEVIKSHIDIVNSHNKLSEENNQLKNEKIELQAQLAKANQSLKDADTNTEKQLKRSRIKSESMMRNQAEGTHEATMKLYEQYDAATTKAEKLEKQLNELKARCES